MLAGALLAPAGAYAGSAAVVNATPDIPGDPFYVGEFDAYRGEANDVTVEQAQDGSVVFTDRAATIDAGDGCQPTDDPHRVTCDVPPLVADDPLEARDVEINAGDGDDSVRLGTGIEGYPIDGGGGDDHITGGPEGDLVFGGPGNDLLAGGLGWDVLAAGEGADILNGGSGSDVLDGGTGGDRLEGGSGADEIDGAEGSDALLGGPGQDVLTPGPGSNGISGGPGQDALVYGTTRVHPRPPVVSFDDRANDGVHRRDNASSDLETGITVANAVVGFYHGRYIVGSPATLPGNVVVPYVSAYPMNSRVVAGAVAPLPTAARVGKVGATLSHGNFFVEPQPHSTRLASVETEGGNFHRCRRTQAYKVRRLDTKALGPVHIKAKFASARMDNASARFIDRCDGTLVRSLHGTVHVQAPRGGSVTLRSGQTYLARRGNR